MTAKESIINLIQELGIGEMPPQDQEEMIESVLQQLDAKVSMRVAERLSDDQFEQYEGLMEQDTDEATEGVKKLVPDYDDLVAEEAGNLKEQIKSMMP